MKLALLSVVIAATAIPAAPALAHCRTVHHRLHHAAWHAPVRHRAVRYAGCGCARRVAYRPAAYPVAYDPPPRVVEVTYERPRPLYRPYRFGYAAPLYRPRPIFYGARFEEPRFRHWSHDRFSQRAHRWGGWR
ncbi:MAG: hypothetical protein JWO81_1763 [Alphaproteobacteria bacterium]|nr:hypothetical protein [Alphaproteobacteria bacterium]